MNRFESVLVLVLDEEPLQEKLDSAVALCRANHASLTLFDAVEVPRRFWSSSDDDLVTREVAERRRQLEAVAASLDVDDVEVVVRSGDAVHVEAILEVDERGHDIVITAPDEPGRARLSSAPTAMQMLRKCPVPVWVHEAGAEGRRGVVVAVGPLDEDAVELNRTLLTLGASVAARRGDRLHVLHAWRLPGETLLRGHRSGVGEAAIRQMVHEAEAAARAGLDQLLADVGGLVGDAEVRLVKGHPTAAIAHAVERLVPRLLVMGTLAHSGARGMIIGNTAERVLGTVTAPVLAVKPPGFVSPVLA